jgi:hypothetical protein
MQTDASHIMLQVSIKPQQKYLTCLNDLKSLAADQVWHKLTKDVQIEAQADACVYC